MPDKHYALSLAVFALAVEDIKDLERVMISATPLALLGELEIRNYTTKIHTNSLLVPVQLPQLDKCCFLITKLLLILLIIRSL
jgi:hypothetical protein